MTTPEFVPHNQFLTQNVETSWSSVGRVPFGRRSSSWPITCTAKGLISEWWDQLRNSVPPGWVLLERHHCKRLAEIPSRQPLAPGTLRVSPSCQQGLNQTIAGHFKDAHRNEDAQNQREVDYGARSTRLVSSKQGKELRGWFHHFSRLGASMKTCGWTKWCRRFLTSNLISSSSSSSPPSPYGPWSSPPPASSMWTWSVSQICFGSGVPTRSCIISKFDPIDIINRLVNPMKSVS